MKTEYRSIGLVGAGLIGGSIAVRLARIFPSAGLLVHDFSPANAACVAERHGAATMVTTLDAMAECDVVFVATPVATIPQQVEVLLRIDGSDAVIIDTGSAKTAIIELIAQSGVDAARFVPGHPLAGGVSTGPGLATGEMITSRPFVLTPTEATGAESLAKARMLLEKLGAEVVEIDAAEHDRLLATGSHLPHLVAFALAGLPGAELSGLLPSSFRAIAAFAGADPQMWSDIFRANTTELRRVTEIFKKRLDLIVAMADEPAPGALLEILAEAKSRADALEDD